jgi:hypothetical protein
LLSERQESSAEAGPSLMRKCPMRAFLRYSALAGMNTKSADGFTTEVQQRQRQRSEKRRPRYGRVSSTPYLKNLRSRSCIIGSVVKTTVFPPAMRWPRIRGKFSSSDGVLQPPSRSSGRIMTKLQKTKARLERAKLVVVAARERAVEMAQQSAARPLTIRTTVFQRRRLAELSARKS